PTRPDEDDEAGRADEGESPFDFDRQREPAEGLPVPIFPGTRVTEAEIQPPHGACPEPTPAPEPAPGLPRAAKPPQAAAGVGSRAGAASISGQLCATEPRARANARVHLEREVTDWLAPDVPAAWKAPAHLIDRLITRTRIEPVVRDYGTLYEATLDVDLGPA